MERDLIELAALAEGEEGIIHAFRGGHAIQGRLAGMGISLNARVKLLRHRGGLVLVQVAETRVALGSGEASKILVRRAEACPLAPEETPPRQPLLVALAGQPNVGKSTVFNILTGLSQHVANWPGKTVEKREGVHLCGPWDMRIVDLPGTYSLTAYSEEEKVTRDFIIQSHPDVIVLLAGAAALERSLYLLAEFLLLGRPVIFAVNMLDVAESQGIHIDQRVLQQALGVPVVPMVATKNQGLRDLVSQIIAVAGGETFFDPKMPEIAADHRIIYEKMMRILEPYVQPPYPLRWVATKLLEGDTEILALVDGLVPRSVWQEIRNLAGAHEDSLHAVVGGRYDWIEAVSRVAVSRFRMGQMVMTDRIDHVLTRPLWGIPLLLAVFAGIFALTYRIGFPLQKILEEGMSAFGRWLDPLLALWPAWFKGLLIDGIIGGVGSVLTFIPILVIFFAVMSFLEDVGYMARAAFVMDRFMHLVGLHGKSFIPLCLGLGCNVPAVLGARIIESPLTRFATILLVPFVPCTARLAVLTFVSAALFGVRAAWVSWGLIVLNLLILGVVGWIVSRTVIKNESVPFIMELPLYHKPDFRTIGLSIWIRLLSFMKKAGSVILVVSVIVWVLAYIPDGRVDTSLLAFLGKGLEPIGKVIGLDWRMMTALLTSLVAKENAIGTLGVLYAAGEEGLIQVLPQVMSQASALAFLVILMLFVPCAGTMAALKQEMEGGKWFIASILLTLGLSLTGGFLTYRIALWAGL